MQNQIEPIKPIEPTQADSLKQKLNKPGSPFYHFKVKNFLLKQGKQSVLVQRLYERSYHPGQTFKSCGKKYQVQKDGSVQRIRP